MLAGMEGVRVACVKLVRSFEVEERKAFFLFTKAIAIVGDEEGVEATVTVEDKVNGGFVVVGDVGNVGVSVAS